MRILSLNIGAFPCIFDCAVNMKNGNQRSKNIADIIIDTAPNYDVLAFQEVWSRTAYDNLVNKLKHIYPYYTIFTTRCCCLLLGSGLVIFSQHQILTEYSEAFVDFRGNEIFAKKGFIAVNIKYIGEVITTHLQAGAKRFDKCFSKDKYTTKEIARKQTRQIMDYVNKKVSPDDTVYITGDFNIEYKSAEYNNFIPIMESNGFHNSTQYPIYTTTKLHSEGVIDYCFIRNAEITTATTNNIPIILVDHKGLVTTLVKL
jgi:exonuclease III